MLFRDVVDLISITEGTNVNGFPAEVETGRRTVYVNKKRVRQTEFYQAAAQGVNLLAMFEMRVGDYNNETFLEYNGIRYYILRTYDKNGEIIELVCSDKLIKGGGASGK